MSCALGWVGISVRSTDFFKFITSFLEQSYEYNNRKKQIEILIGGRGDREKRVEALLGSFFTKILYASELSRMK